MGRNGKGRAPANKLAGEFAVEVGQGTEKRSLRFRLGINEMITLQEEFGIEDDKEFFESLQQVRSMKRVRAVVRAALLNAQPEITHEEAGDIIMQLGFAKMGEIITEVFERAVGPEPADSDEGKARAPSPGARSS